MTDPRRRRAAVGTGLIACMALAAGLLSGAGSSPGGAPDRSPDGDRSGGSTSAGVPLAAQPAAGFGANTLAGQRTVVGFPGTSIPRAR